MLIATLCVNASVVEYSCAAVSPTSAAGKRARPEFTKSFKEKDDSKRLPTFVDNVAS